MAQDTNLLRQILEQDSAGIVQRWIDGQLAASTYRADRISRSELAEQSRRFLSLLREASASGSSDVQSPSWANLRQMLEELSASRALQGFSPAETATFILSLKEQLFDAVREHGARNPEVVATASRE